MDELKKNITTLQRNKLYTEEKDQNVCAKDAQAADENSDKQQAQAESYEAVSRPNESSSEDGFWWCWCIQGKQASADVAR